MLGTGEYLELRENPLHETIQTVETVLKQCHYRESNHTKNVQPHTSKIPKPGNEIQEIIAAANLPTQNFSKWLSSFKELGELASEIEKIRKLKDHIL